MDRKVGRGIKRKYVNGGKTDVRHDEGTASLRTAKRSSDWVVWKSWR